MTFMFIQYNSKIIKKHLVIVYFLLMIVSLLSCEDILEKPIDPYATTETEEALNDYLIGAYAHLAKGISMYNLLSVKSDDINLSIHSGLSLLSDYPAFPFAKEHSPTIDLFIISTENFDEWIYAYTYSTFHYTDISLDFYRTMYRSILMCNKLINDLMEDEKKEKWSAYLGEAYFLRAYLYFKMVRVFGRLPLVADINVNYELPLADFSDIYNQIEKDLIEAISYLPENRYSSRKGAETPHKGTAKVLLAEVYLTMGGYPVNDNSKYAKAAETALEVIENAEGYGFGLMDDFANLWQWRYHDNEESVWSIYYQGETFNPKAVKQTTINNEDIQIETTTTEEYYFSKFPNNYRKEMTFWQYEFDGIYEPENILSGIDNNTYLTFKKVTINKTMDFNLQFKLFNSFHRNVIGKKQTINFSCYPEILVKTFYPPYKLISERPEYYISNKLDQNRLDSILNYLISSTKNPEMVTGYKQFFPVFRFAHTLLTYAEASARSGNPDAMAYEAVNRIRRRANKLPVNEPSVYDLPAGLSAEALADSVVAERGWEFCHEFEGRWNDIIRLQLYPQVEANRYYNPIPEKVNKVYNGQTYFIPLPQEDIWLNPNLE